MNKKDLNEIRRRLNFEHNAITCIRGCYVQKDGEIISSFTRPMQALPREEAEKYLAIFRRVLSGEHGQNLLDVDFSPEQVMNGAEHRLLTRLRDSALKDDETAEEMYRGIISSLRFDDNCLILMLHDGYDVPFKGTDGENDPERSDEVFHYILCAVCPVKLTKPVLTYSAADGEFHTRDSDWAVSAPALGFMFPAFDERACNIYGALLYTKDTGDANEDFVTRVMGTEPSMPADVQKETFGQLLEKSLGEECSLEAVQSVQDMVLERTEEMKKDKKAAPPVFSALDVRDALVDGGVSMEKADAFTDAYGAEFGPRTVLSAANVAPKKQFEVRTPAVTIRVDPERSDLVETRVIDGHSYILIRADEDVTVNGVAVRL